MKAKYLYLFLALGLSACSDEPSDTYWGAGKGLGDEGILTFDICMQRLNQTVNEHGYKYSVTIDKPDDFLAYLLNKTSGVETNYSASCRPNSGGLYTAFVDIPP